MRKESKEVRIRLTEEEHQELREKSLNEGLKPHSYCKMALFRLLRSGKD